MPREKPLKKYDRIEKIFWSVASGKGGTGKSVLVANLSIALAVLGYKVLVIDADMGGANLHLNLQVDNPEVTLNDFILKRFKSLEDVVIETPCENLKLISGGTGLIGLANLPYQTKLKLIRNINKLDSDFIIVDLGAGTTFNTVDFFNMSNEGIIVSNPEPSSRNNAFAFLKNVVFRRTMPKIKKLIKDDELRKKVFLYWKSKSFNMQKLLNALAKIDMETSVYLKELLDSFIPKLIINKTRKNYNENEEDLIITLTKNILSVKMEFLGHIHHDQKVMDATENMQPFIIEYPGCKASKKIYEIAYNISVKNVDYSNQKFLKTFETRIKAEKKRWMKYLKSN